ncbi:unnamed protein product [Ixodes persulcatus]
MNFLGALFCGFVAFALIENILMAALPAYGEVEVVDGKWTSLSSSVDNYRRYRICRRTASLHTKETMLFVQIFQQCAAVLCPASLAARWRRAPESSPNAATNLFAPKQFKTQFRLR